MAKKEKTDPVETVAVENKPTIHDLGWTDYVLGLLSDDEKIKGNPTTDGLRRIFEIAMNCRIISSCSQVTQSPSPENEKRATVVHSITYVLNPESSGSESLNTVSVDGSADVYWGNCDKVYRNHPVAVAETRAEGRALRRALRLRKVISAEEMVEDIEDHPDSNSVSKISNNQINFIDVMAKRLNINVRKLLEANSIKYDNIYDMPHDQAVSTIRLLSKYQQDVGSIAENLLGYTETWKE
jgi:hypothetical protein